VVTNNVEHFTISVSGEGAKKITHAVLQAKRERRHFLATAFLHLQFYKGTNFLCSITSNSGLLLMDHEQHFDESEVLKALDKQWLIESGRGSEDK
jgi:hypothetical protein